MLFNHEIILKKDACRRPEDGGDSRIAMRLLILIFEVDINPIKMNGWNLLEHFDECRYKALEACGSMRPLWLSLNRLNLLIQVFKTLHDGLFYFTHESCLPPLFKESVKGVHSVFTHIIPIMFPLFELLIDCIFECFVE